MQHQKILIVDDEPGLVKALVSNLDQDVYEISTACDGVKGLEMLSKGVDLAVVDVKMPKMDGITLVKVARERKIQTPILILTGYGSLEVGVKAMKAGANDVLEKPVGREAFCEKINQFLPPINLWRESFEGFFEGNYGNASLTLDDIIKKYGFSKTSLCELLKKHLGQSFRQQLLDVRLTQAELLLKETSLTITEIAIQCGFGSLNHFGKVAKTKFGCSASEYRKKVNKRMSFEQNDELLELNLGRKK